MKLLVIGHSVVDRIKFKGEVKLKPGGIHYSIAALSSFKTGKDEIFLCSSLSKKHEDLFSPFYNKINKKYVKNVDEIPEVYLVVKDDEERDEKYNRIIDHLVLPDCDLNIFDGILINMISGYDINLLQMKEIRKNFRGNIFFDVHTFSRGLDKKGNRNFRRIDEFKNWAVNVDILQANEGELKTLSDKSEEAEIADELISYGIKTVIVTKSERGSVTYLKKQAEIKTVIIPSVKINTVNKVGCGDVFGAVFFYNYIRCKDIVYSLEIANVAAGISATYSNITDFKNLKTDVLQRYS